MRLTRLILLSTINNYKEKLHEAGLNTDPELVTNLPFVAVTPKDEKYRPLWKAPCVVIYASNISDKELQIGGGFWHSPIINFDIYGLNEGQLYELIDITEEFVRSVSKVKRYDLSEPTYQVSDGLVRTYYESGFPNEVCQMSFDNRIVAFLPRNDTIGEATAHSAQLTTVVSVPNM
jgi:hypothetical protein